MPKEPRNAQDSIQRPSKLSTAELTACEQRVVRPCLFPHSSSGGCLQFAKVVKQLADKGAKLNSAFLMELLKLAPRMPDTLLLSLANELTHVIMSVAADFICTPAILDLSHKAKASMVIFLAACCRQRYLLTL